MVWGSEQTGAGHGYDRSIRRGYVFGAQEGAERSHRRQQSAEVRQRRDLPPCSCEEFSTNEINPDIQGKARKAFIATETVALAVAAGIFYLANAYKTMLTS